MDGWRVEDLERLEDETLRSGDPAQTARELMRVADSGRLEAVSRAAVLTRAGEQWQLAGHLPEAADLFQRAIDDGGRVHGDARAYLADVLYELGRHEEAATLITRIRDDGPRDPVVYHCVAETLEAQRDLAGAHDWATRGAAVALDAENSSATDLDMLLRTRFRVRRDLGLAEDSYDAMLDGLVPTENS